MKIALCHLELSCGPQERNLQLLEQAVSIAAEQGADWVLTPEAAVQGYYFITSIKRCGSASAVT